MGNWKGMVTAFSCRLIDPAGSNSDVYPRIGTTDPSVGEPIVPSDIDLSLKYE